MDLENVVNFSPFDNLIKGNRTLLLIQSFDNKTNQWNRKYFQTNNWSNGSFSETTDVPKALQSFDERLHINGISHSCYPKCNTRNTRSFIFVDHN